MSAICKIINCTMEIETTIEKKLFVEETWGYSAGCFSLNVTTAASTYRDVRKDQVNLHSFNKAMQKVVSTDMH